eukprot:5393524-Prymnesium_polylepis.2
MARPRSVRECAEARAHRARVAPLQSRVVAGPQTKATRACSAGGDTLVVAAGVCEEIRCRSRL